MLEDFIMHKTLAIVGFVLALVVGGLPGLIVSAVALKKMKDSGDEEGKGFAIAGLVLGIIVVAVYVLAFLCIGGLGACAICAEAASY